MPKNECTRDVLQKSLAGKWSISIEEDLEGVNSLFKWFSDDSVISSILSLDNKLNVSPENIFIDKKNNTITISEPTNQRCVNRKVYDITLDLTYHDYNAKDKGQVEQYLKTYRIEQLRNYLEWLENPQIKLQEGDVINLRFLWTIEFEGASSPIMDKITLHYMSKCWDTENTFEVLHDTIEYNSRHDVIRLFYGLKKVESDKDADTVGWVYTSIDSIMEKIEDEFSQRYGKYSEGTFLLNHLINNPILTQYKKNQITMLFFDWLFQLSPSDRETFVKKYAKFPASIYEFNVKNIQNSYKETLFFKNFFTKHIFKELPILNTLCPISNEGESLDVYIIGMNVVNDLTVQSSMKDFYTNYLLKNCNVFYQ